MQDLVDVYRMLAARCDYPLHLGLTEAGLGTKGIIASTAGLSILLQEGIGDTIRVSLTPAPGGDRTEEVQVAQQILQSLGLRSFTPQVTACPGCGRTTSTFFQEMAQQIQDYLRERMPLWRERAARRRGAAGGGDGLRGQRPGESKHAHIGISLPGTFEEPKAPVYVDGRLLVTLKGDGIVEEFLRILEQYVASRYRRAPAASGLAEPAVPTDRRAGRHAPGSSLRDRPWLAFPLLFGAGLATSLTPCVYPMIPITAGILGGAGSAGVARGRAVRLSLIYALGLALVYSALGLVPASPDPVRRGELEPVGLAPHGEPAAGVRSGPVGRLYGERPGSALGLGGRGGGRLVPGRLPARRHLGAGGGALDGAGVRRRPHLRRRDRQRVAGIRCTSWSSRSA